MHGDASGSAVGTDPAAAGRACWGSAPRVGQASEAAAELARPIWAHLAPALRVRDKAALTQSGQLACKAC